MKRKIIKTGIITVSDKIAKEKQIDYCGPIIRKILDSEIFTVIGYQVIPKQDESIQKAIFQFLENLKCDLILTSGEVGLNQSDVTPEATEETADRILTGFTKAQRFHRLTLIPHVMISRAIYGAQKEALILNLFGNEKEIKKSLEAVLPAIPSAVAKLIEPIDYY